MVEINTSNITQQIQQIGNTNDPDYNSEFKNNEIEFNKNNSSMVSNSHQDLQQHDLHEFKTLLPGNNVDYSMWQQFVTHQQSDITQI